MAEMGVYVMQVRPVRPDLNDTATEEEDRILGEHVEQLKRMLDDGRLIMAGPCEDGAFGLVVFRAESLAAAEADLAADAAVRQGVFTGEVHPFRIYLASFDH